MNATMHVKLEFDLDPADGHGYLTEGVCAELIEAGQCRVLNSPFFVFGVSAEDIVAANPIREGVYKFQRVLRRGGHSTYRIFLQGGTIADEPFQSCWNRIEALGATYENANGRFVSVDIPPEAETVKIRELLQVGEQDGIWVFEEANLEGVAGRVQ